MLWRGEMLRLPRNTAAQAGLGLTSGFLTGFGSVGGPPLVLLHPRRFRSGGTQARRRHRRGGTVAGRGHPIDDRFRCTAAGRRVRGASAGAVFLRRWDSRRKVVPAVERACLSAHSAGGTVHLGGHTQDDQPRTAPLVIIGHQRTRSWRATWAVQCRRKSCAADPNGLPLWATIEKVRRIGGSEDFSAISDP